MVETRSLEGVLREHPFLAGLSPEHVALMAGCAKNVRFAAAERLFVAEAEAEQFYLLRQGRVALELDVPGRGPVTIGTHDPPEVLGWSWLVPPYRWLFDARAIEPTAAIALDGTCLRGKCEEDHELGYQLYKRFLAVVQDRLQDARMQLLDVYGRPGAAR